MYEIDFLPVESESGPGSKSGDAIAVRFNAPGMSHDPVIVIDGGYSAVGEEVVEHVREYFGNQIDLIISTHPDADHLNGIKTVVEQIPVRELLIHRPRLHASNVQEFSNLESVDDLIATAGREGVTVTEPFAGLTRFGGALAVLGPTASFYEQKIAEHLAEATKVKAASTLSKLLASLAAGTDDLLSKALSIFPVETLAEDGVTGPRNDTSVVTLITAGDKRLLFTGDAGIPALSAAADLYEGAIGPFSSFPLDFFQVPHHGSRRNLSPSLLDRVIGPKNAGFTETTAFISSAKASKKHPSPKVTNALGRRGANVCATEGRKINTSDGAMPRPNWTPIAPIPPLVEDANDE